MDVTRAGSRTTYPDTQIFARLVVLVVHTRVADVWGSHDHDLSVVRRIGQRLLIAGHPGREDGLAEGLPLGAVRLAAEGPAVLEHQQCLTGSARHTSTPFSTVGVPRRNVATTRPGSSIPAYGVLRDSELSSLGTTVRRTAGS